MSDTFNTTVANWQGVESKPTPASLNLVNSGGIKADTIKEQYKYVGKNLFSKRATIDGCHINWDGSIAQNSDFCISEYIPVESGASLYINWTEGGLFLNWYDENMAKLSTVAHDRNVYTVPSGAEFVIVSIRKTMKDMAQVEYGSTGTAYEEFNNTVINPDLFKLKYDGVIDLKNEYANVNSETLLHMIKDVKIYNAVRGYTYSVSYLLRNGLYGWQAGFIAVNNSTGVKTKLNFKTLGSDNQYINITDIKNVTMKCIDVHDYFPPAQDDDYTPFNGVIFELVVDFSYLSDDTSAPATYDANNILPVSATCVSWGGEPELEKQRIAVTVKRYGTSGVDADFCGLNAIGDAINSITDASEDKVYDIIVDGHFMFTDPNDFIYGNPYFGGYAIAGPKKYINIIGTDKNRAILEVAFDENTVFPSGKSYMDYQPLYVNTPSEIKNLTIIGDACRYVSHVETNYGFDIEPGEKLVFDNCLFYSKDSVGGRTVSIFGTGGGVAFDWYIKNSEFRCDGHTTQGFGYHTSMNSVAANKPCSHITLENCDFNFNGELLSTVAYNYNRQDVFNIIASRIGKSCMLVAQGSADNFQKEIGVKVVYNIDSEVLPTRIGSSEVAIRIKGAEGTNKIRFADTTDNEVIVTDKNDDTIVNTDWGAVKTLGFEYKDSTNGKNAYACSYKNVSPTTGTSIGARLGDCSSTSKTLRIVIDDANYDVVFNQDMTNVSNADIVTMINSVISSVATCDLYDPTNSYFPNYKNITYNVTTTESFINKGMGVVFTGMNTVRKATRSDDKIDGIALDDIASGQTGRIGGKGCYMSLNYAGAYMNNIYPVLEGLAFGNYLSIDESNDGQFVISNAKPVMKVYSNQLIELL